MNPELVNVGKKGTPNFLGCFLGGRFQSSKFGSVLSYLTLLDRRGAFILYLAKIFVCWTGEDRDRETKAERET